MDQERIAQQLATTWHEGQTDKSGQPYIAHPQRVAARVTGDGPKAVAWLHDVLEDTAATRHTLVQAGITDEVITAVEALTKRDGEAAEEYFARVRTHPWAVTVKHADLDDNTDPERVARLDPDTRERLRVKYERARTLLQGSV